MAEEEDWETLQKNGLCGYSANESAGYGTGLKEHGVSTCTVQRDRLMRDEGGDQEVCSHKLAGRSVRNDFVSLHVPFVTCCSMIWDSFVNPVRFQSIQVRLQLA